LCIDLLADTDETTARTHALNYVSALDADADSVTLRDAISRESFRVRPQIVINAGGPWIDFVNRALGLETRFIGGTKGSHLMLDQPELFAALGGHEFYVENDDGRILLIMPFHDRVLVGTTDIRIDDPDDARCTDEEIDYLLALIPEVFPSIAVNRSHILMHFSGVRPLPHSEVGYTGQISRDHSIKVVEADGDFNFPILNLVGGKWTSFRAFSEQVSDDVLTRLGHPRTVSTRNLAIGGGRDYPQSEGAKRAWIAAVAARSGLADKRIATLLERYGTRAEAIADFCGQEPDDLLVHHTGYSRREIAYLALHERVVHLDDLLLRRSLIGWLDHLTDDLVDELSAVLQNALGWTDDARRAEVQRARDILRDHFGIVL
jgi:glycerol-3-phosphate dehydrogenase